MRTGRFISFCSRYFIGSQGEDVSTVKLLSTTRWFTLPIVLRQWSWCNFYYTKRMHLTLKRKKKINQHLSLFARKPVFGFCDHVPAQLSKLGRGLILDIETRGIILSRHRATKALIRLRGYASWSAPSLFTYGINRFSHDVAHWRQTFTLIRCISSSSVEYKICFLAFFLLPDKWKLITSITKIPYNCWRLCCQFVSHDTRH